AFAAGVDDVVADIFDERYARVQLIDDEAIDLVEFAAQQRADLLHEISTVCRLGGARIVELRSESCQGRRRASRCSWHGFSERQSSTCDPVPARATPVNSCGSFSTAIRQVDWPAACPRQRGR